MSRVIEKTVFTFEELPDRARERARDWYRNGMCNDWEPAFDEFKDLAKTFGIEFKTRSVKLYGGGTRGEPLINYSVGDRGEFCSYEGTWSVKSDALVKFKEMGWKDDDLLGIAEALTRASLYCQLKGLPDFHAHVTTSDRDDSMMEVSFDSLEDEDGEEFPIIPKDICEAVETALQDFASYMLKCMSDDYEWRYSDECVDENIQCNEYEFDEDGDCA